MGVDHCGLRRKEFAQDGNGGFEIAGVLQGTGIVQRNGVTVLRGSARWSRLYIAAVHEGLLEFDQRLLPVPEGGQGFAKVCAQFDRGCMAQPFPERQNGVLEPAHGIEDATLGVVGLPMGRIRRDCLVHGRKRACGILLQVQFRDLREGFGGAARLPRQSAQERLGVARALHLCERFRHRAQIARGIGAARRGDIEQRKARDANHREPGFALAPHQQSHRRIPWAGTGAAGREPVPPPPLRQRRRQQAERGDPESTGDMGGGVARRHDHVHGCHLRGVGVQVLEGIDGFVVDDLDAEALARRRQLGLAGAVLEVDEHRARNMEHRTPVEDIEGLIGAVDRRRAAPRDADDQFSARFAGIFRAQAVAQIRVRTQVSGMRRKSRDLGPQPFAEAADRALEINAAQLLRREVAVEYLGARERAADQRCQTRRTLYDAAPGRCGHIRQHVRIHDLVAGRLLGPDQDRGFGQGFALPQGERIGLGLDRVLG